MKVIDTNVAIDFLRGHAGAAELLLHLADAGEDQVASELMRYEVLAGARTDETEAIENFFQTVLWVPVNETISRAAAEFALQLRRAHSGIDDVDMLIAATADVLGAELLTKNVRHFPMFPGLRAPY
ncbi:MAG: type II toxin-antitoxin system VapC family toxin [Dehalococcoidia bacterium]